LKAKSNAALILISTVILSSCYTQLAQNGAHGTYPNARNRKSQSVRPDTISQAQRDSVEVYWEGQRQLAEEARKQAEDQALKNVEKWKAEDSVRKLAEDQASSGLLDAVLKGDVNKVRSYLSSDSALAFSKPLGQKGTLIFLSATLSSDNNGAAIITILLDCGVSPDDGNPLNMASGMGHLETVELLLRRHANVNNTDSGKKTPLILAAKNGFPNVVKLLLENGADIGYRDLDGKTALEYALEPPDHKTGKPSPSLGKEENYKEVVRLLRNFKAKQDAAKAKQDAVEERARRESEKAEKAEAVREKKAEAAEAKRASVERQKADALLTPNVIARLASQFKDADQAADIAFHINAALGMEYSSFNPMLLNLAALSGANDDIKRYFQKELRLNPPLSSLQLDYLSQYTGLTDDELRAFQVR
jgi:hypothetical protein